MGSAARGPKRFENLPMTEWKQLSDWIYAWRLDNLGYSTKEGYSAFNALAGFAVAQGVALTAVAKGEGRTGLVLSIYLVAALLTVWWTASLLKATRFEIDSHGTSTPLRAFDLPSIQHGRFTLTWTLVVAIILAFLAANGLLPNQTAREPFPGSIVVSPYFFGSRPQDRLAGIEGSKIDRQTLDQWLSWITKEKDNQRLVWLQQQSPFPGHHTSIHVELTYNAELIAVSQRVAFLVKADDDSARPNLRQLKFDLLPPNFVQTDRFTIVNPDPGERLVVLCFIEPKKDKTIPSAGDCEFKIVRR